MSSKLGEIFELFDSQNMSRISADDVSLESVPMDIIMIFKPLLLEMEMYQESLDKDEFIESAV